MHRMDGTPFNGRVDWEFVISRMSKTETFVHITNFPSKAEAEAGQITFDSQAECERLCQHT